MRGSKRNHYMGEYCRELLKHSKLPVEQRPPMFLSNTLNMYVQRSDKRFKNLWHGHYTMANSGQDFELKWGMEALFKAVREQEAYYAQTVPPAFKALTQGQATQEQKLLIKEWLRFHSAYWNDCDTTAAAIHPAQTQITPESQ
mgnify:FL=1